MLQWSAELGGERALSTYEYLKQMTGVDLSKATYDYMNERNMIICGDPERCIQQAKLYQEAGTELLLCHMQTYKISHQQVMDSIRLFGKHVIPYFK